jgi:hypothetical protein
MEIRKRFQRSHFILVSIILTVVCPRTTLAAPSCVDLFKSADRKLEHPFRKFRSSLTTPPRVSITSFAGLGSFHESRSITYDQQGDRFVARDNTLYLMNHRPNDSSYLDKLQRFPLRKMVETGYLNASEARMFQNLAASLDTRQITFFEVSREASAKDLEHYPDELLSSRFEEQKGKLFARTASLWSVAGQVLEREGVRPVHLPWEKEPARRGQELDRKKVKYVWEWGRASQDIPEEIDFITSASSANIYLQLLALGGKLDEAYVMMHSFDKTNSRLYESQYPGSKYPADWGDPNDCLFLVPLAQILKKHPPSLFSSNVRDLVKKSEGRIGDVEALNLILEAQNSRWQEWDLGGKVHQAAPIVLTDFSHATTIKLGLRLSAIFHSDDKINEVLQLFRSWKSTIYSPNSEGKYSNSSNVSSTAPFHRKLGAIEISNIDPELAKRDPRAVATILTAVYVNLVQEVSHFVELALGYPPEEARYEAIRQLRKFDVKIAISANSPEIRRQCEELAPIFIGLAPAVRTDANEIERKATPWLWNESQIYVFNLQSIQRQLSGNETYYMSRGYDLVPGYWIRHYFLSQISLL